MAWIRIDMPKKGACTTALVSFGKYAQVNKAGRDLLKVGTTYDLMYENERRQVGFMKAAGGPFTVTSTGYSQPLHQVLAKFKTPPGFVAEIHKGVDPGGPQFFINLPPKAAREAA